MTTITVQKISMDGRACYVFHPLVPSSPICEYDGPLINPPIEVMDDLEEAIHFISDNSITVWSACHPKGILIPLTRMAYHGNFIIVRMLYDLADPSDSMRLCEYLTESGWGKSSLSLVLSMEDAVVFSSYAEASRHILSTIV